MPSGVESGWFGTWESGETLLSLVILVDVALVESLAESECLETCLSTMPHIYYIYILINIYIYDIDLGTWILVCLMLRYMKVRMRFATLILWQKSCLFFSFLFKNCTVQGDTPRSLTQPLKNDGLKKILSFWGPAYFQGLC